MHDNKRAQNIKNLYAAWAPTYDESLYSVAVLVEEDILIKKVDPHADESILDVGCGTGRFTQQLYSFTADVT